MAIDPNIALGYKGIEAPNPLAQYAQVAQIQNAQNQNAMAQYQLNAAKRADELTNVQNELYAKHFDPASGKVNMNALTGELAAKGFGGQIPAMQAKQQELEGKLATTSKAKADAAEARRKIMSQAERDISTRPSDANITAYLEDIQSSDLFSAQEKMAASTKMKQLLAVPMAQRADILAQSGATAGDLTSRRGQNMVDAREFQRIGLERERVNLAKEDARLKREGIEGISPKELQKREAALPAATQSVKGFEAKSDSFIRDLEALRDHPGLEGITGAVYGRTPSVGKDSSAAQALYDKVVAKGGFQALQDLRDASKTGGALGNVSNQEGKQLSSSFAAIQRTQSAEDVKAAINQAIADIEGAKTRTREAYDSTYSYKRAAPAGGGVDAANPLLK